MENCPECSQPIKGRSDKKYCSAECRNSVNNRLKQKENQSIRLVNQILRKNRRILLSLVQNNRVQVSAEELDLRGFHFGFFTHAYRDQNGQIYQYVYDCGYLHLNQHQFLLVQDQTQLDEHQASA